jgi:regulator of nonsense transcripts 2
MKTQQAAEREEQQRIKNLVLNYDLRDGEDQDGDSPPSSQFPNPNIHRYDAGLDKAVTTNLFRPDKSGNNRSGQRARRLQLSDVDWYAKQKSLQSYDSTPLSENTNNQSLRRHNPGKRPGDDFLPNVALPRHVPVISPRKIGTGRLSRKEILQAHAALKAHAKNQPQARC